MENNPIVLHEVFDGDFKNMNDTEISSSIIDQHQQVIALYAYLKGQAVIPYQEELLNNLLKLEPFPIYVVLCLMKCSYAYYATKGD